MFSNIITPTSVQRLKISCVYAVYRLYWETWTFVWIQSVLFGPFSVACVSCNITVILCVNVIFMQRIWCIMSKSIPRLNSFEFKNMFNVAT